MRAFFHAVGIFIHHLRQVEWAPLGLALACHVTKLLFRARAWQNIIRAAYPGDRLKYRSALGAYVAGVGVNSIAPARGGDLIKLYLVKHRMKEAKYPTLALDADRRDDVRLRRRRRLMIWALSIGVLPTHQVYSRIPTVDWKFFLQHETATGDRARRDRVRARSCSSLCGAPPRRELLGPREARLRDPRRPPQVRARRDRPAGDLVGVPHRVAVLLPARVPRRRDVHNALLAQVVDSLATLFPATPGGAGTKQGLIVYLFRQLGDLADAPARVQRRHEHRDHDREPRARRDRDRADGADALVQHASPPGRAPTSSPSRR